MNSCSRKVYVRKRYMNKSLLRGVRKVPKRYGYKHLKHKEGKNHNLGCGGKNYMDAKDGQCTNTWRCAGTHRVLQESENASLRWRLEGFRAVADRARRCIKASILLGSQKHRWVIGGKMIRFKREFCGWRRKRGARKKLP